MKKLISIFFLFNSFLGVGQEPVSKESKFSVGINFSPNYSYRILKYSDEQQRTVDSREKNEQASFGFNTGIAAQYLITENLEIELGFQFSRQTNLFNDINLTDATGSNLGTAKIKHRYQYLELPIRVNYRLLNKNIFAYITIGASFNHFLDANSKSSITNSNGETEEFNSDDVFSDFNTTTYALIGGLGLGYHLSKKLNVRFEPLFRYSLTPLVKAPIDQHNYSIGGQVGINMKL